MHRVQSCAGGAGMLAAGAMMRVGICILQGRLRQRWRSRLIAAADEGA